MVRVSGGQAVVEALKAQGVQHLFFLLGSYNVEILDALYDAKEIRGVAVRHEQTAAHMADAYARITGSHGVTWA